MPLSPLSCLSQPISSSQFLANASISAPTEPISNSGALGSFQVSAASAPIPVPTGPIGEDACSSSQVRTEDTILELVSEPKLPVLNVNGIENFTSMSKNTPSFSEDATKRK